MKEFYLERYILVLVKFSYLPEKKSITRNVPSEVRRILVGPSATGKKRYPWLIEGLTDFLETSFFSLIKPLERGKGRGKVGTAEGAIALYRFKKEASYGKVLDCMSKIKKFCEEWKEEGKVGIRIYSYKIGEVGILVAR